MKQELFPCKSRAKWTDEYKAQTGLHSSKLYWTLSYFS